MRRELASPPCLLLRSSSKVHSLLISSGRHGCQFRSKTAFLAQHFSGRHGGLPGAGRLRRVDSLQADRCRLHGQSRPERPDHRRPDDRRVLHLSPDVPAVSRNPLGQFAEQRAGSPAPRRSAPAWPDGDADQRRRWRARPRRPRPRGRSSIRSARASTKGASSTAI